MGRTKAISPRAGVLDAGKWLEGMGKGGAIGAVRAGWGDTKG